MKKTARSKGPARFKAKKGFLNLPPTMAKKLGVLVLLLIVLPALALAAQLATQLYSKAYLPPSVMPSAICKEALKTSSFDTPCTPPRVSPTKTTRTTGRPTAVKAESSYTTINFTCIDGFKDKYTVSSCVSKDQLLNYAYSICNQHSTVKTSQVAMPCKATKRQLSAANYQKTYKQITYTCGDNYSSKYNSITCQTEAQLKARVVNLCRTHSVCLKVTPTPTNRPTPTLTPTTNPTTNTPPTITTTALPLAYIGQTYNASVRAIDQNQEDSLRLSFSGLPSGLRAGPCAVPAGSPTEGVRLPSIECYISGTPTAQGKFLITATVTDSKGSTAVKQFPLYINTSGATPYPTRVIDPNKY